MDNLLDQPPNASASADAGPAKLTPTKGIFVGKVWLINRAIGIRLHAVVGRFYLSLVLHSTYDGAKNLFIMINNQGNMPLIRIELALAIGDVFC